MFYLFAMSSPKGLLRAFDAKQAVNYKQRIASWRNSDVLCWIQIIIWDLKQLLRGVGDQCWYPVDLCKNLGQTLSLAKPFTAFLAYTVCFLEQLLDILRYKVM